MDAKLLREARRIGAATLHEASGQTGALPSGIKPIAAMMRLAGPAFPVATAAGDNIWLHRALTEAKAGDVLVAVAAGHHEAGYWGGIMTASARARGLSGLAIDGCVRDGDSIAEAGFPVFARGLSIRGTKKDPGARGSLGQPITIGEVTVEIGDLVVGDGDGVVVIARARIAEVMAKARAHRKKEKEVIDRLRKGETTLEVYGWE